MNKIGAETAPFKGAFWEEFSTRAPKKASYSMPNLHLFSANNVQVKSTFWF